MSSLRIISVHNVNFRFSIWFTMTLWTKLWTWWEPSGSQILFTRCEPHWEPLVHKSAACFSSTRPMGTMGFAMRTWSSLWQPRVHNRTWWEPSGSQIWFTRCEPHWEPLGSQKRSMLFLNTTDGNHGVCNENLKFVVTTTGSQHLRGSQWERIGWQRVRWEPMSSQCEPQCGHCEPLVHSVNRGFATSNNRCRSRCWQPSGSEESDWEPRGHQSQPIGPQCEHWVHSGNGWFALRTARERQRLSAADCMAVFFVFFGSLLCLTYNLCCHGWLVLTYAHDACTECVHDSQPQLAAAVCPCFFNQIFTQGRGSKNYCELEF